VEEGYSKTLREPAGEGYRSGGGDKLMVLNQGVARLVLGCLVPLLLAPTTRAAQPEDDAPLRCFRLHGDAALRACQEMIGSNQPAEVRAAGRYNRGVEFDRLGRHAEALVEYAEAVRLKPDYAAAYTNMGVVFAELERWDDAVGAYRQAIHHRPAYADAYYNLGVALTSLRRWVEALDAFGEAARLNSGDADAHYNMGVVLSTLHRHSEALEAYRAAVRVRPRYAAAWGNLGMTAYLLGRFEESKEAFETARTLIPDYFDTRPIQRAAWDALRLWRTPMPARP